MTTAPPGWLRVAAPVFVGALVLAIWQFLVSVVGISDYLLPSPASILGEFGAFLGPILTATWVTGLNSLVGLVMGSVFGVVLAMLAARSRIIDWMSAPIVASLAVVPIVALAPVLNSMYGADAQAGRQIIATLAAFVPVFVNSLRGFRQVLPVHRDLMRSYSASSSQVLRTVTLPTAVPFMFTGVRIASSLAVISALVAEYFGGPKSGLGSSISTYASTSLYARAWAFVLASIILGLVFYAVTSAAEAMASRRGGTL